MIPPLWKGVKSKVKSPFGEGWERGMSFRLGWKFEIKVESERDSKRIEMILCRNQILLLLSQIDVQMLQLLWACSSSFTATPNCGFWHTLPGMI